MGCGFNWDCVSPLSGGGLANGGVVALTIWNSELYAAGDIYSLNGAPAYHIARWDGTAWQHLSGGLNGMVQSLRSYPDGLYAVGSFTEADGIEANGLARWDGEVWHSVFDLPLLSGQEVNLLNDMAWYQGELYIGGNFGGGNGLNDIARWDGNQWTSVQNGFLGVTGTVQVLEVHDDLLYVAGSFSNYPPFGSIANPGSGIVTWDGAEWATLGTGTDGSQNPMIYSLTWIRDTLYVSGRFNRIDGIPTGRIARWDGTEWCSLVPPNYFYPDLGPVGSFRDTLIIGGSFTIAGPDSINRIAKWEAGTYVDSCSISVGLHTYTGMTALMLSPNPASSFLNIIDIPVGSDMFQICDVTGRLLSAGRLLEQQVEVHTLSPGNYFLTLLDGTGRQLGSARFVKD